jgi:signal transduction histidine kinase
MEIVNIFGLSGLVNGLIALGLGFFIIFHNWRDRVNQLYFLIVVAISIWTFSYWRWLSSTDSSSALFWVRMLSIGSTLIPIFYFHWVVSLLNLNRQQKNAVRLVYFLAFLFLLFSFSDLFVKGVRQKLFFPFWPDPGILYHFYLVFAYLILVIFSLFLLFKSYKVSPKEKKGQIIYVLVGSVVAFGGGLTNFFLWYDIPFPPYGNFLIALYPFLFGYATLKHHLFNVRVVATELFTIAIWAFLLVKTLLSTTVQDLFVNLGLLVAVIFFGVLLVRSVLKEVRQRERLEVLTNEVKKAYEVEKHARQELQRLDKAKTQFIMATQHHLRTPLTSMRGYLDLIFGGTYGKVPAKLKKTLQKFQASTSRLIRTVNEFLDISQFQLGKRVVLLEPDTQIEPILKEIIEELKFEAESKGLYLKLEKPDGEIPAIKADPEKLKVALFNVLDNAVKYTRKGGVTIRCKKPDNKLRIIIKDTGIGVPREELRTLFTRIFERGEKAKQVFTTGRGIGLYITAQIIKAHNGKIWAESEGRNKGSTFYVELPLS